MVVVVPEKLEFPQAGAVYVTGGSNNNGPPDLSDDDLVLTITLALADHVRDDVIVVCPVPRRAAGGGRGAVPDPQPARRVCGRPVAPAALGGQSDRVDVVPLHQHQLQRALLAGPPAHDQGTYPCRMLGLTSGACRRWYVRWTP